MAEELHVLFGGVLPAKAALARAMKELRFPLSITPAAGSLEEHSGFLPMRLRREETGVELSVFNGRDVVEELAEQDVDPGFDRVASFRWSSDESEMLAGLCAATALAKLTNGVVLEEWDGRLLQPDEAVAFARQHLKAVKAQDRDPGTRPADIKRYLRPLLELRSDLVLVGRLLLVRPVRHVLRGALLDRTSDKYSFRMWPYVRLLCDSPGGVGYLDYIHDGHWKVWQPHFEALLLDCLAEEVFARVGTMTTLADVAAALSDSDRTVGHDARVTALVLSGQRDEAADHVREMEPRLWRQWAEEHRAFIARDIDEVCAEFHAREAKTVKAMKLEEIWEPSPFPVELPVAERRRCAEPVFSTAPWISRPPGLLQDLPDRPGDVRFAKSSLFRNGEMMMLVALTREQAESRHRDYENYVLAAPLTNGLRVLLWCHLGKDRHDPRRHDPPVRGHARFLLVLEGSGHAVKASFWEDHQRGGFLECSSLGVLERRTQKWIWRCNVGREDRELHVYDCREGKKMVHTHRALSDAERALLTCPVPVFGEFEELSARARAWLRSTGYGDIA